MKNMMKIPSLLIALAAFLLANVPVESFVTPSGPVRVATKSPLVHIPTTPFSLYLAGSVGASTSTSRLHASAAAPALQVESKEPLNPSWRSIIEIPIPCDTQEQFDSIPAANTTVVFRTTRSSWGGTIFFAGASSSRNQVDALARPSIYGGRPILACLSQSVK
jgi:hypothetical protein